MQKAFLLSLIFAISSGYARELPIKELSLKRLREGQAFEYDAAASYLHLAAIKGCPNDREYSFLQKIIFRGWVKQCEMLIELANDCSRRARELEEEEGRRPLREKLEARSA